MNRTERSMLYGFIAICLLVMIAVPGRAGSITGLDYDDCTRAGFLWWSDECWQDVEGTINDNDVNIDADTLGGQSYNPQWTTDTSGMSWDSVMNLLSKDYEFTRDFDDYNTYMLVQVTQLLLNQQDEIMCTMKFGIEVSDFDLTHCMARRRADRTGVPQELDDGYKCWSHSCVKFVSIPGEPQEPELKVIVSEDNTWKLEALSQWDNMCDLGISKWCVIAQQNREAWGME